MNRGLGDPRDMYIDQFCALVWFLTVQDKEPEEVEMMKAQLWIPPQGVSEVTDPRSPWHPDNQLNQLRRVKSGTGSKSSETRAWPTSPSEPV